MSELKTTSLSHKDNNTGTPNITMYSDGTTSLSGVGGRVVGYQQGEWIATPAQGTITNPQSEWTRIGNLVTIRANLRGFTNTDSQASIQISGVPYSRNDLFCIGPVRTSCLNYGQDRTPVASLNTGDLISVSVMAPTIGGTAAPTAQYVKFSNFITVEKQNTALVFTLIYQTDDTTWQPINGATVT